MPFSKRLLCVAATVAAVASLPVRAENKAHSLELGAATTFIHYDSEVNLSNHFGWSGFLHYNFTARHGAEIQYTTDSSDPLSGPAFQVDFTTMKLGYVFTTSRREKLLPFFRVGLGLFEFDVPDNNGTTTERLEEDLDGWLLYSGGGVRIAMADWWGIKVGAGVDLLSTRGGIAHPDIQGTGDLGLYVRFGGRSAGEKPAAPADEKPAEPPKDEAKEAKPPLR